MAKTVADLLVERLIDWGVDTIFGFPGAGGYTIEEPGQAEEVLRAALAHPGPAVVQAVVDPNEPPMPGKITTEQALHFAEALAKGQRDRWGIIKTVLEDTVREVV